MKLKQVPQALGLAVGILLCSALPAGADSGKPTKLLRFPDLHGDQVVFTYAGDLWTADAAGGDARRLTTHPGVELFGRFSPDGKTVAFTGQYEGDEQVYVVEADGGEPRQLTFYPAAGPLPPRWGYDNQVYDWTADGKSVLFRSLRDSYDVGDPKLFLVPAAGGLSQGLPMPFAGGGDLSPGDDKVVYSPLFRDFRHWKRYEGGWAQNLYIFDLKSHASQQITSHVRTERDAMWIGDTVYFSADWDGKLNLYAYDIKTAATRQLTRHQDWDVRWPAADKAGRRIVYELGGELRIFDIESGNDRAISIHVPTDALNRRPTRRSVEGFITGFEPAPEGKRALFVARGDLFTAPLENGPTRNLTRSPGVFEREATWSPDGTTIAFVSDQTGEEELWLVDQAGREKPRQMTSGSKTRYSELVWSPDSRFLAYRNAAAHLLVLDTTTKKVTQVADDTTKFGLSYSWSPCSTWIAFSMADATGLRSLYLWNRPGNQVHRVTDELWHESNPTFDPKGDYLFYLSARMFQPQISSIEFDYALDRETGIFALALRKDVPNLFAPKSDEVNEKKAEAPKEEKPAAKADAKTKGKADAAPKDSDKAADGKKPIVIDLEGLAQRSFRVPVDFDNIAFVVALEGRLLWMKNTPFYYGREAAGTLEIHVYDLATRKDSVLVSDFQGFGLASDGSKMMVRNGGFQIYDTTTSGKDSGKRVATDGIKADWVPAEEWNQIFDDAWRRFRDFFYVANMHGYDWQALHRQYKPLLEHVAHRSDLNYVIAEMISELNASHSYVAGGDFQIPPRPQGALLGARFELDAASGRYRIAKIFAGQNEEDVYRSPLREVGVNVAVGDYVLAINGEELAAPKHPEALLRRAEGDQVELLVNAKPVPEGARRVVVRPTDNEDPLIYLEWIEMNREYVAKKSGGRLGYLHVPDMGADGIREFIKWYYGQTRKEGLVIDVRSNGGGNISQMILNRLTRKVLMVDFERHHDGVEAYPDGVFPGHLVCLIDEDTASDGDQFAHVFRAAGLGPLIGKRSWGGVVGIYGNSPLIDGGGVSIPEVGSADPQGKWIIEGRGVDPDIEVDNDPGDLLKGKDAQLDKAIEVLLEKIAKEPRKLPGRPADPVKTGGSDTSGLRR